MRCLYISYDGALEPLGQSQIIAYLKALSKKGIKFTLVSFDKKQFMDKKKIQQLCEELQKVNIKWVRLRYHKSPPVVSTIFDIFCGFVVCLAIAIRKKPEFVHARSYVASLIALALKKILKVKFIFDMRGFWADERAEGRVWAKKGSLYHFVKFLEKHFFKSADEIVVLTKQAKKIIKDWGYDTSNISVIPSCVDVEKFEFDDKSRRKLRERHKLDGKFIFVHTGSLEYWYMKEEMLGYFKIARQIQPRAHFLILTHAEKNSVLKSIFDKNLDPKDFTILSVPYVDMPKYLAMADVGLIFITPVFSKMASSPTKFAEYLSCGLPVIINERIGDLEECVIENNVGLVIRDFNQSQYRQTFTRLLNLLNDEKLKFRCRQAASDNFNLDAGVDKYYEIYSRLK